MSSLDNYFVQADSGSCGDSCGGSEFARRADDNEATVRSRLDIYNKQTSPLVDFYGKAGILRTIDGMAEISQVTSQIAKLLEGI